MFNKLNEQGAHCFDENGFNENKLNQFLEQLNVNWNDLRDEIRELKSNQVDRAKVQEGAMQKRDAKVNDILSLKVRLM